MTKTPENFSKTQIYLHWLVVALIAFQYLFHDGINLAWKARMDAKIPNEPSFNLHVLIGVLILILVFWRLFLRMKHGVPALPKSKNKIAGIIAKSVHHIFYLLLIALPLSGAGAWFLGIKVPASIHILGSNLLIAIIILHISAALLHHFVLKTDVMKKMLGMK